MLLEPDGWSLAHALEDVLPRCPPSSPSRRRGDPRLGARARDRRRTDASATRSPSSAALRADARARARAARPARGCRGHASVRASGRTRVVSRGRALPVRATASMRELARREPTFALHVHVGVADPEDGDPRVNRMRAHLPLLLALSANSPFWQGRDTGLASARTPLFQAFPRVGIPRRFARLRRLRRRRRRADALRARSPTRRSSGGTPGRSRASAPSRSGSWTRRPGSTTPPRWSRWSSASCGSRPRRAGRRSALIGTPEVLDENRFLAARDGIDAEFIDPGRDAPLPRPRWPGGLDACRAARPGPRLRRELEAVAELARYNGADAQRAIAASHGLAEVVSAAAADFAAVASLHDLRG